MKSFVLVALVLVCFAAVSLGGKRDPPRPRAKSLAESDVEMKQWLSTHPFLFQFPSVFERFFIDKLVVSVDGFTLPPGQLWCFPEYVWNFRTSWWFDKIINVLINYVKVTRYSSSLFWYRMTNSGFGIVGNINPGEWKEFEAKKTALEAAGKKDTPEWRKTTFQLSANLFHTSEDDMKMVAMLEELCHETTLTDVHCDDPKATDPWKSMIRNLLMSGYFRMGENDNCRDNHSFESCLMPLQGTAVHTKQFGSTQALKYMLVELVAVPDNIGAKWLLNLAHMTLGTYPVDVPAAYLISPELFESEYDIKTFHNVEELLDIDTFTSMGTGIFEDFDGDGLKDIFQCSASYNRNVKYYKNMGDGKFQDRTAAANLQGITGGANCRQADFNNDGHVDIFLMRGGWLGIDHVNGLLRNNGNGTFTDIAFYAGISSQGATHTMDFGDINKDGLLDMFVANEDLPCELWLNLGNDTVANIADAQILDCGLVKGAVFTDYNDDLWPDIFISRYAGKNRLLRNDGKWSDTEPGKWSFTDVTDEVGLGDPWFSFPCTSFDADQDGTLDILVAGHLFEGPDSVAWIYINESTYLNRNHHNLDNPMFGTSPDQKLTRLFLNKGGKFEEIGAGGGLRRHVMAMASNYGDLDNDGYLDLYFGTGQPDIRAVQPNKMYRNSGDGAHWQDVTSAGNFGHLQKGHGIAFADFDNDGDLDVYGQMGGAFYGDFFRDAIYLNPGHGNGFIKIRLRGVQTNRDGLGSRIYVHTVVPMVTEDDADTATTNAATTTHIHHHFVSTGGSYGSNPLEAHIGLGKASIIEKIVVWWQSTGIRQEFSGENLTIGSTIRIVEGTSSVEEELNVPTFSYDLSKLGDRDRKMGAATCH